MITFVLMAILSAILLFIACAFALFFSPFGRKNGLKQWMLPAVFGIKVIVGLAYMQLTVWSNPNAHLETDTGAFLHEAKIINDVYSKSSSDYWKLMFGGGDQEALALKYLEETKHWSSGDQSFFNDHKNILRTYAIVGLFSDNSDVTIVFFFALIGTLAIMLLYAGIRKLTGYPDLVILGVLVLIPSSLWWTSVPLKEPMLVLGLATLFTGFFSKTPWKKALLILTGLSLTLMFKSYVLLAVGFGAVVWGMFKILPKGKFWGSIGATIIIAVLGTLFIPGVDSLINRAARVQFDFDNVAKGGIHVDNGDGFYYFEEIQTHGLIIKNDSVQLRMVLRADKSEYGSMDTPESVKLEPDGTKWPIHFQNKRAESYIRIPRITTKEEFVLASQVAVANVLFRPTPGDPGSNLKIVAFAEMTGLLLVIIIGGIRRRKNNSIRWDLFAALLGGALALAVIIGSITPVLGATVRYRLPIIIAFTLMALLLRSQGKKQEHG